MASHQQTILLAIQGPSSSSHLNHGKPQANYLASNTGPFILFSLESWQTTANYLASTTGPFILFSLESWQTPANYLASNTGPSPESWQHASNSSDQRYRAPHPEKENKLFKISSSKYRMLKKNLKICHL
jgi:hypothetical protein